MKLIVGLGNPGKDYNNTRHNMGFMMLDAFALAKGLDINQKKFQALYVETNINQEKVILMKPQTYMNDSGLAVKAFVDYYKLNLDDILIISDDLDLPFGKIKLKKDGSCGGHNGLRSIEEHLGTIEYKRLKIGISHDDLVDTKDYVLGHFSKVERTIIKAKQVVVTNLLDDYLVLSFDNLMNKYNVNE